MQTAFAFNWSELKDEPIHSWKSSHQYVCHPTTAEAGASDELTVLPDGCYAATGSFFPTCHGLEM